MNGVSMWSWAWWKDVSERAIRTAAQAALALLVVGDSALGLTDINWADVGSLSGGAALASILMSIATHGVTGNGPSFNSVYKDKSSGEDGKNDRTDAAA